MSRAIPFADLALARRLEHAEGSGNVAFVEARAKAQPDVGATWTTVAGTFAMFDGVGSPCTQTFGLGLDGPVGAAELDQLEAFFLSRGASVCHEVSPLAGVELFALLASRGYKPVELSTVLFQPIDPAATGTRQLNPAVKVRQVSIDEAAMFAAVSARGWSEAVDVRPFIEGLARIVAAKRDGPCFVAEIDGVPIATGAMNVWHGVALLAGASTVPEGRRQGAQLALLDTRLRFAASQGCDVAMMCTAPGSTSQRNAERNGFRIAYTRTKWQLSHDH
jgi:Acetyltransferase (GNAT) domain